ncbi:hypothetical protein ACOMHN_052441 [Nucella lapillus]
MMQSSNYSTNATSSRIQAENNSSQDVNRTDIQAFLHQRNLEFLASIAPTLAYLVFIMVAGMVGNSIVLAVYWKRFSPSVTRTYILAISVCALLTTSLSLPAELLEVRYYVTFTSPWACKLSRSVKSFFSFLAAGILVAVALERHRKLHGPYFKCVASMKAGSSLRGCVIFSFFVTLPLTILAGSQTVQFPSINASGFCCSIDDVYVNSLIHVMYNVMLGLTFITCFVIITVSYVRIARLLWQHQQRVAAARRKPKAKFLKSRHEAERKPVIVVPSVRIEVQTENADGMNGRSEIKGEEGISGEQAGITVKDELEIILPGSESDPHQEHNLSVPGWMGNRNDSFSSDCSSLQPVNMTTDASSTDKDSDTQASVPVTLNKLFVLDKDSESEAPISGEANKLSILDRESESDASVSDTANTLSILDKDCEVSVRDKATKLFVLDKDRTVSASNKANKPIPILNKENEVSHRLSILSKLTDKTASHTSADTQLHPAMLRLQACTRSIARRQSSGAKHRNSTKSTETPSRVAPSVAQSIKRHSAKRTSRFLYQPRKLPTRTTSTMFVLTVICVFVNYFPSLLMASLSGQRERVMAVIGSNGYHMCQRSYFIHTVLNPLVLCFCSVKFRRECRRFFHRMVH